MGVNHTYGALATGGGWSLIPTPQDNYLETLFNVNWTYQTRSRQARQDPMGWRSKWSFGCTIGYGDVSGADGAAGVGMDMIQDDYWNPPNIPDGSQGLKFIKGSVVDTSDAALSGANVMAFRTSDNAYAGYTVQSRTDGSYDLATNFPGVNHFVVAYLAGSPDRTTATLNTLTPTNIDGT